MKKTLIIALCCMALSFVACKKPVEPTPDGPIDPVDYTENYIGSYVGSYGFNISSINGQPQTFSFEMDSIRMDIAKGTDDNVVTATVTIDDVTRQTTGIAKEDKASFDFVHLGVVKPEFAIELEFEMEATKGASDILNITGTFTNGTGWVLFGQILDITDAEGTLTGELVKQ
jgi:hypothetical protein